MPNFSFRHLPTHDQPGVTNNFEQLQLLLSEGLTAENLKAEAVTEAKLAKALLEKWLGTTVAFRKLASGEATLEYTAKSKLSAALKVATGLATVVTVTASSIGKGELGVGVKIEGAAGEVTLQAWFEKEELPLGTKVKAFWIAVGT